MQWPVTPVLLSLELRSAHLARPFHEPSDQRSPAGGGSAGPGSQGPGGARPGRFRRETHLRAVRGRGAGPAHPGPLDRPRLCWRTRDNDPLSTFLRLFLVEVPVELGHFRRAVAPMDPADWANLGLVTLDGATVRGAVAMRASGKLLIAHDCSMPAGGKRPDYVLGVTGATLTLCGLTVRRPSRRTLDLGAGSGFQALTAGPRSEHVVGTDRNSRAVAIARFNALLN